MRLPTKADEKSEPLWKTNLKGGDYWFSSPVLHDGLIYAVNGNRNFSVVEAKTGKLAYVDRLEGGANLSEHCAAGSMSSSAATRRDDRARTGREYKEVSNQLETFRSSPTFEGRRMYVRTQKNLWCIGE
ncbi:MAG: PQQ-binding-like beta-propeller repeat protein [Gemmataceae bacterium]